VRGWPLWRKVPLGLLRYPGLLAAVVIGALLLALVSGAYPVFLSRSEGRLLQQRIADPTIEHFGAGLFYGATNLGFSEQARDGGALIGRIDARMEDIAGKGPGLEPPIRFILGPTAVVTLPGGVEAPSGRVLGALFFGSSVTEYVDILSGSAEGTLLPDLIADFLGVGPGDRVEVHAEDSRRFVTLRVAGVYRSLFDQPRSGYWSPWSEQLFRRCPSCPIPPQAILVSSDQLVDISQALGHIDADYAWTLPVRQGPLTLDDARAINSYSLHTIREAAIRGSESWRVLRCCGTTYQRGFPFRRDIEFRSSMPLVLQEVERRAASIEGPLRLLLVAGLVVAGAAVAASAAFAVAGRRTEVALLHARGWGPGGFAGKSALESALPMVGGALVGLALGWWLIATFGPSAPAAPSARSASIEAGALAFGASLGVFGVASAVSFSWSLGVHSFKHRFAWLPWEVLAIAGALWLLSRLHDGGALIRDPQLDIRRPSALLLAFPVLFLAGFATLGTRLLVEALRRTQSKVGRSPVSYLAVHRMTTLPTVTVLLVAAVGTCLGVFVNGQTMVRSLRATVDAKAKVFVGSDVQVQIDYTAPEQERFPLPITRATRLKYAGRMEPGDVPFDILGIDAGTIVGAAYWDDAFSDESLADLVDGLRSDEGPLPAILVQGSGDPTSIRTAQAEIPIHVVGRAVAFPGVSSDDPVIVVDLDSLKARVGSQGNPFLSANARTEYWIAGDTDEALAAVGELEAFPLGTLTADEVKDVPFIAAAIETFSMLNLLGLAAALLVVGVLVVYLQARQRARTVSNVLSLRMGMRDGQAMRALVLELGSLLLVAFLLGGALGLLAGALVSPLLDPLQTIPPPPLFAAPTRVLAWTLVALGAVALVGGWIVHRRAAAVDLGEVLRVAE
jgi:putative ABC transport system permease protein